MEKCVTKGNVKKYLTKIENCATMGERLIPACRPQGSLSRITRSVSGLSVKWNFDGSPARLPKAKFLGKQYSSSPFELS